MTALDDKHLVEQVLKAKEIGSYQIASKTHRLSPASIVNIRSGKKSIDSLTFEQMHEIAAAFRKFNIDWERPNDVFVDREVVIHIKQHDSLHLDEVPTNK